MNIYYLYLCCQILFQKSKTNNMKIKMLFFVVAAGLVLASCSDKEAATKIADLEKAMKAADSVCLAEKTMLMDSIMSMQTALTEMEAAKNAVSSNTSSNTGKSATVKVTTPEKKVTVGEKPTEGKKGIDIKKKGGATGGN